MLSTPLTTPSYASLSEIEKAPLGSGNLSENIYNARSRGGFLCLQILWRQTGRTRYIWDGNGRVHRMNSSASHTISK